jgi:hypothetical protein
MKQFLNELENVSLLSIGLNNTTNNFMTKYHENHSYENCRLIKINENFSNDLWRELLKKIGLDLLCVSAHYSKRYENSDTFIENKSDEELKSYVYYLKNSNASNIVDEFCNKYIISAVPEYKMEWKNLHFVWKQFLSNYNLPNVIYSNTLKNIMKEKFEYVEENDSFIGITSKHLPTYGVFIKFWENTITAHNLETEIVFDNELEIDELCGLFKHWVKQNSEQNISNGNISEENILKILKHFFPNVEIVEDKFVLNVTCSIWNKMLDINNSFEFIKQQIYNEHKLSLVSFDDVYNYYYKYCNNNSLKFIVSKRYFEKYLYFKLSDHIVYDKFIETSWLNTAK